MSNENVFTKWNEVTNKVTWNNFWGSVCAIFRYNLYCTLLYFMYILHTLLEGFSYFTAEIFRFVLSFFAETANSNPIFYV